MKRFFDLAMGLGYAVLFIVLFAFVVVDIKFIFGVLGAYAIIYFVLRRFFFGDK